MVPRKRNPALRKSQDALWAEFQKLLELIRPPVDVLLVLGDAIEGPQRSFRGIELIEPDLMGQCEMAVAALAKFEAHSVYMVRGSPYHVGEAEEFEDLIAEKLQAEIANEMILTIEGVRFHLAHFVQRSTVPHGRATPLAREWVVNVLMGERGAVQRVDVLLRGHVHYYTFVGGSEWLAMSAPALSFGGGKIRRRSRGLTDFGLILFEIEKGEYHWKAWAKPVMTKTDLLVRTFRRHERKGSPPPSPSPSRLDG